MIVNFPYSASRRVYSRRPRRSKNGTPEERAAKAAAGRTPASIIDMRDSLTRQARHKGAVPNLSRQERRKLWREAENRTEFFDALLQLRWRALVAWDNHGLQEARAYVTKNDTAELALYRGALAIQLLTPVACLDQLNWKRRTVAKGLRWIPVSEEAVERVMADDAVFLAENKRRRADRRTGNEN